jgi:ADP-ribose pyrophosphatase YjhB (NUDIX family)
MVLAGGKQPMRAAGGSPIVAAGAVVWRGDRVLIVKRGRPPRQDEWSIPGGKVQWGETVEEAIRREVREETGVSIEIVGLIGVVDSLIRDEAGDVIHHHVLVDFAARAATDALQPGDDVAEAHWVSYASLDDYPMWSETRRIIAEARALSGTSA